MAQGSQPRLLAGRYRRLSTIGVGGMARVYVAEDEVLGRQVAVKQLHSTGPEDAALRFEREAKLGASLNHPNLVSIYDIATDEESVLIVMEYVDGETLQGAIRRGGLAPERAAEIVCDIAAGLDHAHAHGVVHRDVKPANILVRRDGVAKLADLGIATAAERTSITRSDIVLGTASYMAPEQLAGERAGPPADVYALAAVAYEALSRQKARAGKTPVEVAHEVVSGAPPDLREAWPEAPRACAATLARGMAREPDRRPPSAGALAADLQRSLAVVPDSGATEATAALAPGGSTLHRPRPARSEPAQRVAGAEMPHPARGDRRSRGPRRWPLAVAALAAIAIVVAGLAALPDGDRDGGDASSSPQARDRAPAASSQSKPDGDVGGSAQAATEEAPPAQSEPPAEPQPQPPAEPVTDDPAGLNDRGYSLMQAGEYQQAIPLFEQAVAAYPEDSQDLTYAYALYNLGRSLRLAGRAGEAVPILERRLAIPNQTETVQRELDAARAAAG
ncbi:MAG TPA: protein kinase [Thermoleophilaceae bacterium]|nr:protein kinase [Thermoleophilaceae bacterium]